MAQHDYNIANQSGADFRSDLNDALSAIASTNSGDTAPATTFANQLWIDTANNLLKIRNEANSAWITTGIDITADNSVDINAGTIDGITTLSFSTGTSVTSILDEDDLSSDSATALATQQSIKAYVDSQVGSVDTLAEILANGNATGGNDIEFGDNDKAIFGTGSDLQIYHTGTQNYIEDAGTGNLNFKSNGNNFNFLDGSDNLVLQIDLNSATKLYHNTSEKLATTSTGIDVTGAIETDGLNSSLNIKVQREFPVVQLENTVTTGRNAYFKQNANRLDLVSQNVTDNGLITFRGDNGTDETEYARFSSNGALFVGKTTSSDSIVGFKATADGSLVVTRSEGVPLKLNRQTSTGIIQNFHYDNSTVGNISVTASATSYNSTSDYRLKENIEYDFTAIERVKDLKPCRFNFITDADTTVDGFIAHEVQDIVPEAISGEKDAVETYIDDEGVEQTRPSYQGIDQSKLVPLLTKAIQEQQAQIESLQAQINQLKGE